MKKHVLLSLFSVLLIVFGSPNVGFGQGTETFTNIPPNNSASITRTWTGDDGSTWTAGRARTDQPINGRAITLDDDQSNAYVESGTIAGGIGNLTITTQRAFSGNSGNMNVSINGSNVGTIPYSASVQTTTISNINVAGNIVIRIDNNIGGGSGGGDDRVKIDDVTWTAFSSACSAEPSAQATDIVFSNGDATSVQVDWTAGTGGDNYILAVNEGSNVSWTPTDNNDYTGDVGGGNYSAATAQSGTNKVVYVGNGTSTSVTGLTTGTDYYFQVFALCENSSNDYLTSSGTGNDGSQNYTPAITYCTVTGDVTYATSITLVEFGDLSYSSGQGSGYDDFTAQTATVTQGGSESITVNLNTDGAYTIHALVWVDWNQDGDFDDGNEEYDLGDATSTPDGPTNLSPLTITVPGGAALGNTTMRVACRYGNDPTGPCDGTDDGEVEDYTVNVEAASSDTEVGFASATTTLQEDGIFADVCVEITNPSATVDTEVEVTLTGGTATNGTDYDDGAGSPAAISFPQTLTFPANSSANQCLTIYISNDDLITEGDETIILGLANVSGGNGTATIGTENAHTVTIPENDQPVIVATPTSVTGFSTTQGTPSASQTFTLEGDYLSGNLTIAAVTGYEYSLDDVTFSTTLTVPVASGNVTGEPRTIYVRLTGAAISTPSGDAEVSGGGATAVDVALSGDVTAAPCSSLLKQSWESSGDTWGYTSNKGDATDGYNLGGYNDDVWTFGTAAQFDGSLTPTDGSRYWGFEDIDNASYDGQHILTFDEIDVSAASGMTVEFDWAASGYDGPDYLEYQLIIDGTPQAAVSLCSSCTSSGSESISIPNGTSTLSLSLIAFQNGNGDYGLFDNVNLCGTGTVSTPVIVATPTSVSGFTTSDGTPSASQTFTLEGDDLSGDLTIAAVAGFEYSLDNTTFTSTLTVPVAGGNVTGEPRTIYVRLTGATVGTPSGDAEVSGGGASAVDVALSGTVTALPCTTPGDVVTLALTPTSSTVDGVITAPIGGASGYVVARHTTTTLGGAPSSASTYTAGNSIGSGTVVYSGTGTTFTDAGPLSPSTEYFYFVFAYNNTSCTGGPIYSGEFEESVTTLSGPCLSENFDAGFPATWSENGTVNSTFSGHGSSAPNARGIGGGSDEVISSSVDYPSSISFNLDASGGGDGETLTLEYRVGAGSWNTVGTAIASESGATETFLLTASPNLTSSTDVTFRFTSSASTVYIDDVEVFCASAQPSIELSLEAPVSGTGTEAASTTVTLRATASETLTTDHSVEVDISGTGITPTDFDNGADFTSTVSIDIANGDSFGELTFDIADDADVEGPETATFTISNPTSGVVIGTTNTVDLDITDNDNTTSTASVIIEQSGEAASISSLINGTVNNNTEGRKVWEFNLYDGDGTNNDADNKPTIYEQFTIRQSGGNTVPIWDDVLDNVKFFINTNSTPIAGSFLVSPTTISFTPTTPITVTDGTAPAEISMRITLDATLPAGTDGQHLGFSLDASDVDVETDVLLSSQLGTFTQTSDPSLNGIDITATLQFIDAPTNVSVGSNFSVTVSAIDSNGNIDTDNTSAITLSQTSGVGTLSGTNTSNLVNGSYVFNGLNHDTEETIEITASGGGFSNISANVNVVDEPNQLFDDFNRVDNNTVGIPSSGGATSWTEEQFGGQTFRAAVDNGELYLGGCPAGQTSGSTGSSYMEQARFNVETYYETIFDNASGNLEWYFNMKQTRTNPSGFGGGNYGAAMVLGCDENDFESATATGYAVIIGNGSTPDPVKLVRFDGGLTSDLNISTIRNSGETDADAYYSVKVTYNPCNGEWNLYVRDDGTSSFADPLSGSLGIAYTATDQTHTSLNLKYFGAAWLHNSSCGEYARFDNFSIPNATSASTAARQWNGSVSADWNDSDNWGPCPGVPTATDDVEILDVATQPVVSGAPDALCNELTVATNATLTINTGRSLTADGDVVNNGTVFIQNGANFIQTQSSLGHSGSGTFVVQRSGNTSGGFNAWSTPVQGGALPGSNGYSYNSSLGTNSSLDDNNPNPDPGWQTHSGVMSAGVGYFSTNGGNTSFTGAANNGDVNPTVTSSAQLITSVTAPSFFNLIGNPYPSAIDADQFISDNSTRIDGALYFWSDENAGSSAFSTDDYATYSINGSVVPISAGGSSGAPNGSIPSCQGFFVNCDASGTIDFNNGQRGGDNTQFFRMAEPVQQRLWLSINNTDLELFNQTLVAFDENATDQKDWGVDAYKLRGNQDISIGAQQDGETYVIATYSSVPTTGKAIQLMTYVETGGTYTFTADSIEGFENYNVYLQDLNDGMLYPLQQGDSYSFSMSSDDEFGRFQLWFTSSLVTGISPDENTFNLYSNNRQVIVESKNGKSTSLNVHVTDMTGRIIESKTLQLKDGVARLNLDHAAIGVYAVTLLDQNGQKLDSEKIIISN